MKFSRIQEFIAIFGLIVVFGIVVFRAYYLSFTTDEAFCYTYFIKASWWRVLFLDQSVSANNHFALTFILKLIVSKISITELALRSPSIIAFGGLIAFIFKFRKRVYFPFFVLFVSFVFSNQLVMDLFSLARGYGISFCFLIAHFYFLGVFSKENSSFYENRNIAILMLFLAVAFNFNLLLYFFSYLTIVFFSTFQLRSLNRANFFQFVREYKIIFVFSLFIFPIAQLINYKQLYFGGHVGVIEDSLVPLFKLGWFVENQSIKEFLSSLGTIILGVGFFGFFSDLYFILWKRKSIVENFWGITFVLCLIIELIQHFVFKTPYLLERTALIYWFLLAGILSTLVLRICLFIPNPSGQIVISLISIGLFGMVFLIPMSYSPQWKLDASNREILPIIVENSNPIEMITVDNEWPFEPGLNYYRDLQNYTEKIAKLDREEFITMNEKYYVVSSAKLDKFAASEFVTIKYFQVSDTYILRKK